MVNFNSSRCHMGLYATTVWVGVWWCNSFRLKSEGLQGIWRLLWSSHRGNDWDPGGVEGDGSGDGSCCWGSYNVVIVLIKKCHRLLDMLVMMWSAIMALTNYEWVIIVLLCIWILSCFRRRFPVVWGIPRCFVSVWTRRRKNLRMKRTAKSNSHACLIGHSGNTTCIQLWQYL